MYKRQVPQRAKFFDGKRPFRRFFVLDLELSERVEGSQFIVDGRIHDLSLIHIFVDHASLLVAWYDGSPGGTRHTVFRALRRGLELSLIHI